MHVNFFYNIAKKILTSLSHLFSNPFSMYLYRCVLVNSYLEINTV